MAKDVDLSSREWLDLVFEGKNKDFGAYELRSESAKRHNKSVLFTIIAVLFVAALLYAYNLYNEYAAEQRKLKEENKKGEAVVDMASDEEEEQDPDDIYADEEEIIELEQVQSTVQMTELTLVEENEYEPPKTEKEVQNSDAVVGAVDQEGKGDMTAEAVKVDVKVVEEAPPPKPEEKKEEKPKPEPKPEKEEVFKSAAHMPSFPGGDAALMKYINDHIKYPQVAQDNGIQGKVIVQFVVEKDGSIGEVKVARGVDKDLDREAYNVCKKLPKFSPGRNAVGDPVRVWYTLPVTFKLQGVN